METDNKLLRIVTAFGCLVAVLHIYGCLNPSGLLWGVDLFAFLPITLKIGLSLLMVVLLFPAVQGIILHSISLSTAALEKYSSPRRILFVFVSLGVAVALFWFGRERIFLLGDGNLIIRLTRDVRSITDIPPFFKSEPLAGYLFWRTHQVLGSFGLLTTDELSVQIVNICCGVIALFVMKKLVWELTPGKTDRLILYVLILASGTVQLFFGYVEVYPPLFLAFLLFAWLVLSNLRGRAHTIFPSLAFSVLFALHFGMICLVPAVILLWYRGFKRGQAADVIWSIAAAILLLVLLLLMCGYSVPSFQTAFTNRERHILSLDGQDNYLSAYGFFSLYHFLDLANLHLLLFPFVAVVTIVIFIMYGYRERTDSDNHHFLLVTAVCGLLFTLIINSEIGLSRDWDLFSTFSSGIVLFMMFAISRCVKTEVVRHRVLVIITGITLLHTAGWVAVNACETSSIHRFQELPDRRIWGMHAHLAAFEELAVYYREKQDVRHSLESYNRYLQFDSTNGRIWASIAHLYELAGDNNNGMLYDEKAVRYGASYPDIYFDLARLYVSNNRLNDALAVLKAGLEKNPESPLSNEYLGTFLMTYYNSYQGALPYFQNIIRIDSTNAGAYYNAGLCAYRLNDYPSMKLYFETFLRLTPDESLARKIRAILQSAGNK